MKKVKDKDQDRLVPQTGITRYVKRENKNKVVCLGQTSFQGLILKMYIWLSSKKTYKVRQILGLNK